MNVALKSLQLITGILIGLLGLGSIIGGIGYYFFITQMSTRPPKPVFAEEREGAKPVAQSKPKSTPTVVAKSPISAVKDLDSSNLATALPPEAYDATVTWKDGLSLKKEADSGSEKVGGVGFNSKVAIIKTSDDKQWVFIQSQTDNLQGWVKAANIDKSAAATSEDQSLSDAEAKPKSKPKIKAIVKPDVKVKPKVKVEPGADLEIVN